MLFAYHSSDYKKIKQRAVLRWIFIGNDKNIVRLKPILDDDSRIYVGREINNISESLRDNFIKFIACLSRQQEDRVLWYSYCFASKSVSQTFIYQRYIYLVLLLEYCRKTYDIMFITDDAELLYQLFLIDEYNIKVERRPGNWFKRTKDWFAPYRFINNLILNYVIQKIAHSVFRDDISEKDVLIHSWIDQRSFQNAPQFRDAYFGDLETYLSKAGMNVGRITQLRVSPKYTFLIRRLFPNIYNPIVYLDVKSFLKCLFVRPKISLLLDRQKSINHRDLLLHLARTEFLMEKKSLRYRELLLYYQSYLKMANIAKKTAVIIHPFENQPWEKMLHLALAKHKRIAYQHCPMPYNWLDYFISDEEINIPLPDIILSLGPKWFRIIQEMYGTRVVVGMAGALRFAHIYNDLSSCRGISKLSYRDILVALPIIESHAIALQDRLIDCFNKGLFRGYRVHVKPHPYLFDNSLRKQLWMSYDNCFKTGESISELLKKCSLLITTGSSVAYEALAEGIKTVYYVPEDVSIGNEYPIKEYLNIVYHENFTDDLKKVLATSADNKAFPVEEYFSAHDYKIFGKYIADQCPNSRRM